VATLLWAATILLLGGAVTFSAVGVFTVTAAPVVIAGVVEVEGPHGHLSPLPGALVHLSGESGRERTAVTDAQGAFRFAPVADGGISVNVSFGGLPPADLELFASPFYASADLGQLQIVLAGSNASASTSAVDTAFTDQESYLTSVGSAAVLLALGGGITAVAARCAARRPLGAVVAAGGATAAVTPTAFYVLGLFPAFPSLTVPSVLAIGLGAMAAALAGASRWFFGPFEGDADPADPSGPKP
jgi:hypothetical protein